MKPGQPRSRCSQDSGAPRCSGGRLVFTRPRGCPPCPPLSCVTGACPRPPTSHTLFSPPAQVRLRGQPGSCLFHETHSDPQPVWVLLSLHSIHFSLPTPCTAHQSSGCWFYLHYSIFTVITFCGPTSPVPGIPAGGLLPDAFLPSSHTHTTYIYTAHTYITHTTYIHTHHIYISHTPRAYTHSTYIYHTHHMHTAHMHTIDKHISPTPHTPHTNQHTHHTCHLHTLPTYTHTIVSFSHGPPAGSFHNPNLVVSPQSWEALHCVTF